MEITRTNTPTIATTITSHCIGSRLIKSIPPPAPKLTKQNFFPPEKFPLLLEELVKTDKKTNLIDKKKNIVEVIPQVKQLEDEEGLFKEKGLPVELSDALNKLFPDVKDQAPPENIETAAPTIDFDRYK